MPVSLFEKRHLWHRCALGQVCEFVRAAGKTAVDFFQEPGSKEQTERFDRLPAVYGNRIGLAVIEDQVFVLIEEVTTAPDLVECLPAKKAFDRESPDSVPV